MTKGYTEPRYGESETNPLRRIRAKILLSSFNGKNNDIYRAVHNLKDNHFFFAQYSKEFFYKTHMLLNAGMLKKIMRLLVYSNKDEIYSEDSQRIINFHSTQKGYFYKLISEQDFKSFMIENKIHQDIDFGIFGNKRVYRARTDKPDFVIFTWSKRTKEINKYKKFFQICWESKKAYMLDKSQDQNSISLDELFV